MKPQLLISAASSGSGKTLFALGLIRSLSKRGLQIQPYKCGTDFMDAQLLTLASDHETVHLDTWLASYTHLQHMYNKYGEKADVCIAEGTAGLFDGRNKMQGCSAEMAGLLNVPIILLVNARLTGYSVAPLIYGFRHFHSHTPIAGVVFNMVSSEAHYHCLREACLDAGADCLGYLPVSADLKLPSKHTALTLTARKELNNQIDNIAEIIEKQIDINRILNLCNRNFPCQYTLPYSSAPLQRIASPASGNGCCRTREGGTCIYSPSARTSSLKRYCIGAMAGMFSTITSPDSISPYSPSSKSG